MQSTDSLRNELEDICGRVDENGDGSVSFGSELGAIHGHAAQG